MESDTVVLITSLISSILILSLIYVIYAIFVKSKIPQPILPVYNSKSYYIPIILAMYSGLTYVLVKYYIKSEPITPTRRLTSSNINRIFDKYSKGTGSLDVTTLRNALNELFGYKLTIVECQRYIDQYDDRDVNNKPIRNGDGKINDFEFNRIITEIKHDNSSTHMLTATVFFICFSIVVATTYSS
jgi:hypothetical protein